MAKDVIKSRILKGGIYPGLYLGGPDMPSKCPCKRETDKNQTQIHKRMGGGL